jgi:hypothetical protein
LRSTQSLISLGRDHSDSQRYFFTDQFGWIDTKHFARAAQEVVSGRHPNDVRVLGFGLEVYQYVKEAMGDTQYVSGFSPEDLPSNEAGVQFGIYYKARATYMSLDTVFDEWARRSGAREIDDPAAGYTELPATDPAVRGDFAGDPSNSSSAPPIKDQGNQQYDINKDFTTGRRCAGRIDCK